MIQVVLVGLGAGAAAALLFASVVSGSIAAIFLFYLAPLPILIAALGWSHLAGLIAAASATAVIAVLSGVFFVAVPVIAFGAWWLGYLTLLARPSANGGGTALEWYPVGRLVLWGAVIGTLIVAAAVPHFGTDLASLQAALRKMYERILTEKSLIDLLVVAVPRCARPNVSKRNFLAFRRLEVIIREPQGQGFEAKFRVSSANPQRKNPQAAVVGSAAVAAALPGARGTRLRSALPEVAWIICIPGKS